MLIAFFQLGPCSTERHFGRSKNSRKSRVGINFESGNSEKMRQKGKMVGISDKFKFLQNLLFIFFPLFQLNCRFLRDLPEFPPLPKEKHYCSFLAIIIFHAFLVVCSCILAQYRILSIFKNFRSFSNFCRDSCSINRSSINYPLTMINLLSFRSFTSFQIFLF